MIQSVQDVIDMDILRSYSLDPEVDSNSLKMIMYCYAVYNKQVMYCQGMNYIAGTLYKVLKDEELTFKCLVGMIERFQMDELYSEDLPMLKLYYYTLNRLIAQFA